MRIWLLCSTNKIFSCNCCVCAVVIESCYLPSVSCNMNYSVLLHPFPFQWSLMKQTKMHRCLYRTQLTVPYSPYCTNDVQGCVIFLQDQIVHHLDITLSLVFCSWTGFCSGLLHPPYLETQFSTIRPWPQLQNVSTCRGHLPRKD